MHLCIKWLSRAEWHAPMWAWELCRISPPRFLAKCHVRRLNQASFVLLYFAFFSGLWLVFCIVCYFNLTSVLYFPAYTDVNGTVIAYVCWCAIKNPLTLSDTLLTYSWSPCLSSSSLSWCRCTTWQYPHGSLLCVWSIHVSVTACRWSHWSVMMLSCSPQFDKSEYSVGHQHHGVIRRLHWLAVHQQITYKIAGVSHYISREPLALLLTSLIWFQTTNQNGHYDPLINCYCLYRGLHLCCQLKPSASVLLQSA